ncbi:hypothetical protein SGLAM104S_06648 [Streptomyces glaucescens]
MDAGLLADPAAAEVGDGLTGRGRPATHSVALCRDRPGYRLSVRDGRLGT